MASPNAVSLAASPAFRFFLRCSHLPSLDFRRSFFIGPPFSAPFCGIYRTNGENCRTDVILVCKRERSYHAEAKAYDCESIARRKAFNRWTVFTFAFYGGLIVVLWTLYMYASHVYYNWPGTGRHFRHDKGNFVTRIIASVLANHSYFVYNVDPTPDAVSAADAEQK